MEARTVWRIKQKVIVREKRPRNNYQYIKRSKAKCNIKINSYKEKDNKIDAERRW